MATKTVSEITVNNIRIGGKAPKKIMKGSTEVKEVKKGSTTVYKKEDVTYTLTCNSPTATGIAKTMTFVVQSYKGSSTPVKPGAAVISNNGHSIASITQGSGTSWNIVVNIPTNITTSTKTYQIGISQAGADGIGVQSITATGTQAAGQITANYTINYRFCNWLSNSSVQSANFMFRKSGGSTINSSMGGGILYNGSSWTTQRTVTFSDTISFTGALETLSIYMTNSSAGGNWMGQWRMAISDSQPSSLYNNTGTDIFQGVGLNFSECILTNLTTTATTAGTIKYIWLH